MLVETLDSIPLVAVLVITIAVVLAAIELGFRTGRWRRERQATLAESDALLSAMTGAHLALLAFIMGFSFNMAAGHYQERRALILSDANAIGTAYQRARLIEAPEGEAIVAALMEYATVRATIGSPQDVPEIMRKSDQLQAGIWRQVSSLTRREQPNILHSLLIQSLNQVFDIHERRVAAGIRYRVPRTLWVVLAGLLTLAMLGMGYFSGIRGTRNPVASTGLAISFSLVLFMIADLDRPAGGIVRSDQSPMIALVEKMRAAR